METIVAFIRTGNTALLDNSSKRMLLKEAFGHDSKTTYALLLQGILQYRLPCIPL